MCSWRGDQSVRFNKQQENTVYILNITRFWKHVVVVVDLFNISCNLPTFYQKKLNLVDIFKII